MTIDVVRQWGLTSLGSRFVRIGEQLRGHTQQLMDAHGVPIQVHHYPLLAALRANKGLPISELANCLGVTQPGVTRSVNQLSDQGFVLVEPSTQDKRVRVVTITPSGEQLLDYAQAHLSPIVEGKLKALLGDQTEPLLALLNHIEDGLSERGLFVDIEEQLHG